MPLGPYPEHLDRPTAPVVQEAKKGAVIDHLIGLTGALESFEGTPIAGLIAKSLEEAGFDPASYDPEDAGHDQYMGFPATDALDIGQGEPNPSPILSALYAEIDAGKVEINRVDFENVHLKPWRQYPSDGSDPYEGNEYRTSHLSSVGMLEFRDAKSGDTLAYAPRLGSDGGRSGYALISINDVIKK